MGMRAWLVVSIVASVAAAGAVEPDRVTACGHLEELAAARQALADGDSATAVKHLERADALLAQCMRDRAPTRSEDEPETRSG